MRWPQQLPPRGVTAYTLVAAEFYPEADSWVVDDKETLHLFTPNGRRVATFLHGTWLRIEVGAPPDNLVNPQEAPE